MPAGSFPQTPNTNSRTLYPQPSTLTPKPCRQLVKADPSCSLNFPTVFNLCTLYDLQGSEAGLKKRVMHHLAKTYGPEEFDLAACKL